MSFRKLERKNTYDYVHLCKPADLKPKAQGESVRGAVGETTGWGEQPLYPRIDFQDEQDDNRFAFLTLCTLNTSLVWTCLGISAKLKCQQQCKIVNKNSLNDFSDK